MPRISPNSLIARVITKPRRLLKGLNSSTSPVEPIPTEDCNAEKEEKCSKPKRGRAGGSKELIYDLTHARHEPSHCLAPGLFRSLSKGERKRDKLEITYTYGEGDRLEIKAPEPLGVDDLRVLQGLIAMAGPTGRILSPDPKSEGGKKLRRSLKLKEEAVHKDALSIRGSYRTLAEEIGYSGNGGRLFRKLRESVERLWRVSIIADQGGRRQGFHLLSTYASDEESGQLAVALNPMIADAVMGRGRYVRIDMREVRRLKSDTTRLLHQRLCAWIDPGKTGRASLDIMRQYVWPNISSKTTERKRNQRVKASIDELRLSGWLMDEYASDKWSIQRPQMG